MAWFTVYDASRRQSKRDPKRSIDRILRGLIDFPGSSCEQVAAYGVQVLAIDSRIVLQPTAWTNHDFRREADGIACYEGNDRSPAAAH